MVWCKRRFFLYFEIESKVMRREGVKDLEFKNLKIVSFLVLNVRLFVFINGVENFVELKFYF